MPHRVDPQVPIEDTVEAMAELVKAARFALAWVLAQGDDIVPIPETKRRVYLRENAATVDKAYGPQIVPIPGTTKLQRLEGNLGACRTLGFGDIRRRF